MGEGDSGAPALCSCASSVQAAAMGVNARHLCVVLLLSFLALVLGYVCLLEPAVSCNSMPLTLPAAHALQAGLL